MAIEEPQPCRLDVPRGTRERLRELLDLVGDEATRQNLIAASTMETGWQRHVLDSLQLVSLADAGGTWVDVGSGAGFPGMVLAIAMPDQCFRLIEPRRLRAEFLQRIVTHFDLGERVTIDACKVEQLAGVTASIISARAVASLDGLFAMASHISDQRTQWLLPKGRTARAELCVAQRTWQGSFRLVPSSTDPDAAILVAKQVRRKGRR